LTLPALLINAENFLGAKQIFLLIMIAGWLSAGLYVSPKARDLKTRVKSASSTEEQEPLEAQFKSLHSLAVKLNGTVLLAGMALLWLSAAGLQL